MLRQLFIELVWPFLFASAWTIYNLLVLPPSQRTITVFVSTFSSSTFFVSWLFAQWFRVQKQQKVDADFQSVESKMNGLLDQIETRTSAVMNTITGGDSACYVTGPAPVEDIWNGLRVEHIGAYPLYELGVRVTDYDIVRIPVQPLLIGKPAYITHGIGALAPNFHMEVPWCLHLGGSTSRRFDLLFTARNGVCTQLVRFKKIDGKWCLATKLVRDAVVLYESVDSAYPRDPSGDVDWS